MKASAMRYTVHVWCVENGAEGEYECRARSRIDAMNQAVEAFQDQCAMTGSFYVPPRHRCQTEIVGVRV